MNTIDFPVSIQTMVIQQQNTAIYFPRVIGLANVNVQQKINQTIFQHVQALIQQQYPQEGSNPLVEMIGTYEIKTNERNILSLTLTNYAYFYHAAHGMTYKDSLTFNVQTGEEYALKDLFKPGSDYVDVLSKLVQMQIKERDILTLGEFNEISPNQDFYIADKSLVLYFQLYEITAYVYGFPMFPISVYEIQDIIDEDGPLGRMAMN